MQNRINCQASGGGPELEDKWKHPSGKEQALFLFIYRIYLVLIILGVKTHAMLYCDWQHVGELEGLVAGLFRVQPLQCSDAGSKHTRVMLLLRFRKELETGVV